MSILASVIRKVGRLYVKPFAVLGVDSSILARLNPLLERLAVRLAPSGDLQYTDEHIAGVRCERTTPTGHNDLTIIYYHGGGFQFGSPKGHRNITSRLALKTKAQILSVEYTLGEFGPAEFEAALVCSQIVKTHGRYMVAGDSAGGNLALHCGHLYGDKLEAVVCISPWVDLRKHTRCKHGAYKDPIISTMAINAAADRYLGAIDPLTASKFNCDTEILDTQVICHYCDDEILSRGIRLLIRNLEAEGKSPIVREYSNLFHVFHILAGILPEANQAIDDLVTDINSLC